LSKFTAILKNRNFFLLWIGQIISQLGDRLGQMALIAFVYSRAPGSPIEIAKILSFTIIPVFIIGPIAGVYVDRWDRRRTMYACDLLRAALVLAIPLFLFYTVHLSFVCLVVFIVFCVGRFFVPAKLSIIPDLVSKENILAANSLVNTTGMIAAILGFGVSGILVERLGARSGFYLDSLSFLTSGTLLFLISKQARAGFSISRVSQEIVEVIRKSVLQEIKEGFLYFICKKDIRFAASISFVLWSGLGAVYVVMIVFVQTTLQSATKDLGLLVMFLGIGLFLGSLIYGRFGQHLSHYKIIFTSLIFSGIMLLVFVLLLERYPYFFLAAALSLILGFLVSPIMIASNTIIHNVSENGMMGKTFSSLEIVMHFGFLLSMIISSLLAECIPQGMIIAAVGVLFSMLGAFHLICHRRIPWLEADLTKPI
jgi:MFS transporter, DHA3 family, macrolide efflux protein